MLAYQRISSVVKRSPLDFSPRLSDKIGCQLYLKKEHISLTGSVNNNTNNTITDERLGI
jgi:threonine dehydratase